jgi:uncharacterized protein (TIGR00369 family)
MEEHKDFDENSSSLRELNLTNFKEKYNKIHSPYFRDLFYDYINKITIEKIGNASRKIIFYLQLDQKCANPFNIAHGGALVSLIENLSTASLFYFANAYYKTLDLNINYKNQVELDKIIKLEIACNKIGNATTFLEAEIKRGDNTVCVHASLIKTKIKANF